MERKIRIFVFVNLSMLAGVLLLFTACETTDPLFDHYQPEGEYLLNWNDLPTIDENEGLKLGGFSGLYYTGGRTFYTITDRGPIVQNETESGNTSYLISPDFTPQIVTLELQNDNTIKVTDQKPITNPAGLLVSGKLPENSWIENETFTNTENISDSWGIYPGGLLMDVSNNFFWFADQYQPALYQSTVEGNWGRRIRPAEGMRRAFGNHTVNGGLTGLDFTTDGDIITIMGKCLENNRASEDTGSVMNYGIRRIGLVNANDATDLSLFYLVEPESYDGIPERNIMLGDISTVNDTSYIVTEYGNYNGVERNLLYMVSVVDSTTKALVGLEGINSQTFETLSPASWRAAKINVVVKRLLLDLSSSSIRKPDAIAIVDDKHIAIIDNNGYGIVNGNVQNQSYQIEETPIKLEIFTLPNKLDLK